MKLKVEKQSFVIGAVNILIAVIVFSGAYLINMKSIGKGSMPDFAIPIGVMIVAMFECSYLMLTNDRPILLKWIILFMFAVLSLVVLFLAYNH